MPMLNPALIPVVAHFGSVSKLARALRCRRQTVYQWRELIPTWRASQIETVTQGRFKASDFPQRVDRGTDDGDSRMTDDGTPRATHDNPT